MDSTVSTVLDRDTFEIESFCKELKEFKLLHVKKKGVPSKFVHLTSCCSKGKKKFLFFKIPPSLKKTLSIELEISKKKGNKESQTKISLQVWPELPEEKVWGLGPTKFKIYENTINYFQYENKEGRSNSWKDKLEPLGFVLNLSSAYFSSSKEETTKIKIFPKFGGKARKYEYKKQDILVDLAFVVVPVSEIEIPKIVKGGKVIYPEKNIREQHEFRFIRYCAVDETEFYKFPCGRMFGGRIAALSSFSDIRVIIKKLHPNQLRIKCVDKAECKIEWETQPTRFRKTFFYYLIHPPILDKSPLKHKITLFYRKSETVKTIRVEGIKPEQFTSFVIPEYIPGEEIVEVKLHLLHGKRKACCVKGKFFTYEKNEEEDENPKDNYDNSGCSGNGNKKDEPRKDPPRKKDPPYDDDRFGYLEGSEWRDSPNEYSFGEILTLFIESVFGTNVKLGDKIEKYDFSSKKEKVVSIGKNNFVEKKDNYGRNLLFHACCWKLLDLVKILVELCDYDVNAKDNFGCTCLHWCFYLSDHQRIIAYLLKGGADIEAKNVYGDVPIDMKGFISVKKIDEHFKEMKTFHSKDRSREESFSSLSDVVELSENLRDAYGKKTDKVVVEKIRSAYGRKTNKVVVEKIRSGNGKKTDKETENELKNPVDFSVVVCGSVNVGKSALCRKLFRDEEKFNKPKFVVKHGRATFFDDIIEKPIENFRMGDSNFFVFDAEGFDERNDKELKRSFMGKFMNYLKNNRKKVEAVIYCINSNVGLTNIEEQNIELLRENMLKKSVSDKYFIIVLTKCDVITQRKVDHVKNIVKEKYPRNPVFCVSTIDKNNISDFPRCCPNEKCLEDPRQIGDGEFQCTECGKKFLGCEECEKKNLTPKIGANFFDKTWYCGGCNCPPWKNPTKKRNNALLLKRIEDLHKIKAHVNSSKSKKIENDIKNLEKSRNVGEKFVNGFVGAVKKPLTYRISASILLIVSCMIGCGVIGGTIVIPFGDIIPLYCVEGAMVAGLIVIWGIRENMFKDVDFKLLIVLLKDTAVGGLVLVAGFGAKIFANIMKFIPIAGEIIDGGVAVFTCCTLGVIITAIFYLIDERLFSEDEFIAEVKKLIKRSISPFRVIRSLYSAAKLTKKSKSKNKITEFVKNYLFILLEKAGKGLTDREKKEVEEGLLDDLKEDFSSGDEDVEYISL